MIDATFWNGEPCEARRIRARVVGPPEEKPGFWANKVVGTVRDAVEVTYKGQTFIIDDDDYGPDDEPAATRAFREQHFVEFVPTKKGDGWRKVTVGGGAPGWPHSSLYVDPATIRERT